MPAIQPDRLNRQVVGLASHFDQPSSLIRDLKHILEFYSNRAQRPARTSGPSPDLASYDIPKQVFRQIFSELKPHIKSHPDEAKALAETLWVQLLLEARLLAANILGALPSSEHKYVLAQLNARARENNDDVVLRSMAENGLATLRKEDPEVLLSHLRRWVASSDRSNQNLGFFALGTLVAEPGFENLPRVFKILKPPVRNASVEIRPYLLDVIELLAKRSPIETMLFLENIYSSTKNQSPRWLLRYSADHFPPDLRDRLRKKLRTSEPRDT